MPSAKKKIRLAIIGIGNVASVLIQALSSRKPGGIWHDLVAGYRPSDMQVVSAFDADRRKVGKDLADAIYEQPNVSPRFCEVARSGITVNGGITVDGEGEPNDNSLEDFEHRLRDSDADLAVNLIPSGMPRTSMQYAEACLRAHCSFINAAPARLAGEKSLATRFARSKLVLVGDDLLSQFGGTAFHKGILDFMNRRGLRLLKSYQLDVGGGSETLRTMREDVKQEKRAIKTGSISKEVPYRFDTVAGTTDYVDYLGNDRTSYFWIQAGTLFGSEVKIDVYLRTNDAANAANILLDVVRASAKCARNPTTSKIQAICDYGFKNTGRSLHLHQAEENFARIFSVK